MLGIVVSAFVERLGLGFFNPVFLLSEPLDFELGPLRDHLQFAHVAAGVEYLSTDSSCIDLAMVRHLTVLDFHKDLRIADHDAIFLRVRVPDQVPFRSLRRFSDLGCSF